MAAFRPLCGSLLGRSDTRCSMYSGYLRREERGGRRVEGGEKRGEGGGRKEKSGGKRRELKTEEVERREVRDSIKGTHTGEQPIFLHMLHTFSPPSTVGHLLLLPLQRWLQFSLGP